MSDTLIPITTSSTQPAGGVDDVTITGRTTPVEFGLVAVDLYRDIHKSIRVEMFSAVHEAGRLDPADEFGRQSVAAQVRDLVAYLIGHAAHEDAHIEPVLEAQLPNLAEIIEGDHARLEDRMDVLVEMVDGFVPASASEQRARGHHLYLELASFSSEYLRHQDIEERVVMPALETAIGVDEVLALNGAIVASIPPDEMARSLASMIPAMNIDDRTELLGGMQAGAPPEVFAGVWSLVGSVLAPVDVEALGRRLGVAV